MILDYRTGPCYTGARGALCVNQLEGVVCTKTLCCATVGKAWGHPCEHCSSRLECETGFLKNQKTGECVGKYSRKAKRRFYNKQNMFLWDFFLPY